jgi:hypothetical protein
MLMSISKNYIFKTVFVFLFFSCEGILNLDESSVYLEGVWQEKYILNMYPECVGLDYEESICEFEITSEIKFINDNFIVKILPLINSNLIWRDTLFSGKYYTIQDTIIFMIDQGQEIERMKFKILKNTLEFYASSDISSNNRMSIKTNSFIWGKIPNKYFGIFKRINSQDK